jgi:hypothetical protein
MTGGVGVCATVSAAGGVAGWEHDGGYSAITRAYGGMVATRLYWKRQGKIIPWYRLHFVEGGIADMAQVEEFRRINGVKRSGLRSYRTAAQEILEGNWDLVIGIADQLYETGSWHGRQSR